MPPHYFFLYVSSATFQVTRRCQHGAGKAAERDAREFLPSEPGNVAELTVAGDWVALDDPGFVGDPHPRMLKPQPITTSRAFAWRVTAIMSGSPVLPVCQPCKGVGRRVRRALGRRRPAGFWRLRPAGW